MSRKKRRARAKRDIPPSVRALMKSAGVPIRAYKSHGFYVGRLIVTTTMGVVADSPEGPRLRLVE